MNELIKAPPIVDAATTWASRDANEEVDVGGTLRALWRRKLLIVALTLLFVVPAAALIAHITPRYRAEARVMVDDSTVHLGLPEILSGHPLEDEDITVLSEIQVILSRDLAKAAIDKLGLVGDPEFNSSLRAPSAFDHLRGTLVAEVHRYLPWLKPQSAGGDAKVPPETRVVDAFLTHLTADPTGRSRVIRIGFSSESAAKAALIANTVARLYVDDQGEAKTAAAAKATKWLEGHLVQLQQAAEDARLAKETFRRNAGLLQGDKDATLIAQEAASVNQQLGDAEARASIAEARLAYVRKALANPGSGASLSEVVQARPIETLRERESALQEKLAELSSRDGPLNPSFQAVEAELTGVQGSMSRQTQRILQGFTSDVVRENAIVTQLSATLAELKEELGRSNDEQAKLATFDRKAQSADALYQTFLDRVKQTRIEQTDQQSDEQVISSADPPEQPYFPSRRTLFALAAFISALIACLIALLVERRRAGFVDLHHAETALGSNILSLIPFVKRFAPIVGPEKLVPLPSRTPDVPVSFAEAVRSLHVRLLLSSGARPKVIMFASALPGEGKTTSSVALALLMAGIGRRVIIIDCDNRRPSLHRPFGISRGPGIIEYLRGSALQEVVRTVPGSDVDVITSGASASHPADLFGSQRMKALLAALAERYDLVILDTPPLMAVADALVLAPLTDKTVYFVRWEKTPKTAAERGLALLAGARADVVGTVLSMVDFEKLAKRDPRATYYHKVRAYYEAS
jgi:polysaccharide biosynthesis transport protein